MAGAQSAPQPAGMGIVRREVASGVLGLWRRGGRLRPEVGLVLLLPARAILRLVAATRRVGGFVLAVVAHARPPARWSGAGYPGRLRCKRLPDRPFVSP